MPTGDNDHDEELSLIAYRRRARNPVEIVPSPRWREWMNDTPLRFPNRCLPLLMANESGWALLNPVGFTARWNGDNHTRGVRIDFDAIVGRRPPVTSTFGFGILTWGIPTLFRTPSGFNLLVRGPVNAPKDGISALEGLVETDWTASTFTMNWKFTRPDHEVRFEEGEPFAIVVPQRRGDLEAFRPALRDLEGQPELDQDNRAWRTRRDELQKRHFKAEYQGPESDSWGEWEGTYFRGLQGDGERFSQHQTKLRLREFSDERKHDPDDEDEQPAVLPADIGYDAPTRELERRYRVPSHVDFRAFPSETVLLDLKQQMQFELNPVAGRMLALLADHRTGRETAGIIASEYGQPLEKIERDLVALCAQLIEADLLRPMTDEPPPA